MRYALVLLTLGLMAGCTCAVNPDQYLGNGDTDAGPDAMIDAGPLPDGGDAGPPLENVPPEPTGAGFSDYQPALGDDLTIVVGPFRDANNDAVTQEFTWYQNDTAITAETGPTLELDSRFEVGDSIRAEVGFSDAEVTTVIDVGPAIVVDDTVTRWNLLLPSHGRLGADGSATFDPVHHRMIWRAQTRNGGSGLWEYQLPATGTEGRWVHLENVRGVPPTGAGSLIVNDPDRLRILFFGGRIRNDMGPNTKDQTLYALDISGSQGDEGWAEVPTSGDPPPTADAVAVAEFETAEGEQGFIFYGGLLNDDNVTNDLYVLWPERGDEWELAVSNLLPAPLLVPATFFDASTGTMYFAGGAMLGGTIGIADAIYSVSVDDFGAGAADTGWRLPAGRVAAGAHVDGNLVTIYGGGSMLGANGDPVASTDMVVLDLTDGSTTPLDGRFQNPAVVGISRAPYDSTLMVYNRSFQDEPLRFTTLDPVTGATDDVTGTGVDMPQPMYQGVAADRRDPGVVFFGGRTSSEQLEGTDQVWYWTGRDFSPQMLVGNPPSGPRWGFSFDASTPWGDNDVLISSGLQPDGNLADSTVFRGRANEGEWQVLNLRMSASSPTERVGHALFRGHCDSGPGGRTNMLGMVGGELGSPGSGNFDPETQMLECTRSGDTFTDCTWYPMTTLNPADNRNWTAVAEMGLATDNVPRYAFMVGGLDSTGRERDEVFVIDACSQITGSQAWQLAPTRAPRGVAGQTLVARPSGDPDGPSPRQAEMIMMFGGNDENAGTVFADVYSVTWNDNPAAPDVTFTPVTPSGDSPEPRMFAIGVHDRETDRIYVYGGLTNREVLSDLWELRLR